MALAHYVQSLGSFPHGQDDPVALDALAKQFAKGGETVPNRIPVHVAMAKLETEFTPATRLALPSPGDVNAAIVARALVNPSRAAQTLAAAPSMA